MTVLYRPNNWLRDLESDIFPLLSAISDKRAKSDLMDFAPKVDIKEEKNQYVVLVDLPGIDPKDIHIEMEKNTLTLKGEKQAELKEESGNYYHSERVRGRFFRQFTLPDNVQDDIEAKYRHGVLTLTIPKMEVKKSKKIMIEALE